jgi:hypothetical protein
LGKNCPRINNAVKTGDRKNSVGLGIISLYLLQLCALADLILQVNTFPLDSKVESLADLSDGLVFSKILGGCRMEYLFVFPFVFV